MFSECSHYIKDTLVGLAGGPSASGGSCGSCVSFGYCGPGGPDELAWHGGPSWSGWSDFGYSWMFSGYLIESKSVLKWKSGL